MEMEMEQIVVKAEETADGDLVVFYIDEDGGTEAGVITSIENIEQGNLEHLQQRGYIIEEVSETTDNEVETRPEEDPSSNKERWLDEEINRLLIFYIDNKETFLNGTTKRKHLWTVACKTMLTGKNPTLCEVKLNSLKQDYSLIRIDLMKGKTAFAVPYYDLCHKAFHDDSYVNKLINESTLSEENQVPATVNKPDEEGGIVIIKKANTNRSLPDKRVEEMLNLYLKYLKKFPKDYWQKNLWDTIALEIGEDGEYWRKRFLNFKQHYIKMLDKRRESGSAAINWPYMKLFDEIYAGDKTFQQKYGGGDVPKSNVDILSNTVVNSNDIWDDTEKTVLVKYCFDCYDEFQDPTIPNSFLWIEIGRLLDKPPEICKQKYEELKVSHLDKYILGGYDLQNRKPVAILFDNIISKETEQLMLSQLQTKVELTELSMWTTEEIDELVQFFHDNTELFKDSLCHFVCWAAISKKLNQSFQTCKSQWLDLTTLYKSVLNDKKEDPDMDIQWRYTDLFDRIFDYGMDTKLLEGYEKLPENTETSAKKIGVKKLNIKLEDEYMKNETDDEEYDERGFVKRSRGTGDAKQFKILEFYQKNKEKFSTTARKKQVLWETLANQIGITAEQCAHRFRNLKQVYTAYIQREINKPEMPILWPYYALCKKVFGYRVIKNKLKNGKTVDIGDEWTPKDIKQLINYYSKNFTALSDTEIYDKNLWTTLANNILKSETLCIDKFIELRKSYRKIKTMMSKNPACKVNWKYFKLFDSIYSDSNVEAMDADSSDEKEYVPLDVPEVSNMDTNNVQEDEDYQCIIVIPEGQELTDISNAQIILKDPAGNTESPNSAKDIGRKTPGHVWRKTERNLLLYTYLSYINAHKGKTINPVEMWKEISTKFPESNAIGCKRIFSKMKIMHKQKISQDDKIYKKTKYCKYFEKILAVKPKFMRSQTHPLLRINDLELPELETYKDVQLPPWKVELALKYYLEHIEEFLSPKYVKKYVWKELANHVSLNILKVYYKINHLKQFYNNENNAKENDVFGDLVNQILEKEFAYKVAIADEPKPMAVDEETETVWTDDEVEELLKWYLENLKKFKNPIFVPSYLWMDALNVLKKSPIACSKKMSQIRTQYSTMVKETPEELTTWRFYELCQKIYGTGRKSTPANTD